MKRHDIEKLCRALGSPPRRVRLGGGESFDAETQ